MQKRIKADILDKVEIHEYGAGKDCVAIIGGTPTFRMGKTLQSI
jgi:hypothetical protein